MNEENKNDTSVKVSNFGEISEQQSAIHETNYTVRELNEPREIQYRNKLFEAIEAGKKAWPQIDFYVVMLTKVEVFVKRNVRVYPRVRLTCPTPNNDQDVYFYDHKKETLEFIWSIPDKQTVMQYKLFPDSIPEDEYCLIPYVMNYLDGTYDRLARQRNGEKEGQVNPTIMLEEK